MYILDTNHCIYLMNAVVKKNRPLTPEEQHTFAKAQSITEPLYISQITLAEMYFGMCHSQRKLKNLAELELFRKSLTILSVDDGLCRLFGETKADGRKQGKVMSDFDLLIGCAAIQYGAFLVTNDQAFSMLHPALKTANWSVGSVISYPIEPARHSPRPEIEALLKNGSTKTFIARRYHTSKANLHRWLKAEGLT